MPKTLSLLTATGCRPEAFSICQTLMWNQTYTGPVRWVIVDDGKDAQKITIERDWEIKVIRREPFWKPGQNTQAQNLLLGLKHCTDKLAIIEDDDYYHPDWLTAVSDMLNHAELVGESHARYYNIRTKTAKTGKNKSHSSLCSTAMRGKAIQTFARVCRPNVRFIDKDLWQKHSDKKLFPTNYVVGIKGMPGRDGIGTGHNSLPVDDQDGSIFKAWVKDHELYAQVGTR